MNIEKEKMFLALSMIIELCLNDIHVLKSSLPRKIDSDYLFFSCVYIETELFVLNLS